MKLDEGALETYPVAMVASELRPVSTGKFWSPFGPVSASP